MVSGQFGRPSLYAMRKATFSILIALALLLALRPQMTEARSGCCSHHGGVCGCGCCDGSPLSAICAPYYPECSTTGNSAGAITDQPTKASIPTETTTHVISPPRPTATPTPTLTPTPTR